jgi:hypothetical protein
MSYEGYDQVLCEKGHLSSFDCFDEGWMFNPICHCGAKLVWYNPVNETNGSFEEDENGIETDIRIDGYIELEVLEKGKRCEHCGMTGEATYKIPQGKGHKVQPPTFCRYCGKNDPCYCWDTICKGCGQPSPICDCDREEVCGSCKQEDCECDRFRDPPNRGEEFGAGLIDWDGKEDEDAACLTEEEYNRMHRATPEETEKYRKAIEEKTGQPRPPRKSNQEEFGAGLR